MIGADNIGAGTPLSSPASTVWVALSLHADERSAREEFDAGSDAVPCLAAARETWAALLDFAYGVERVRASMDDVDGLHSQQSFTMRGSHTDAITVTFWRGDAALRASAYRPGEHKFQLDRYRELETADCSSFTSLVALDQRGTWHGGDLLAW